MDCPKCGNKNMATNCLLPDCPIEQLMMQEQQGINNQTGAPQTGQDPNAQGLPPEIPTGMFGMNMMYGGLMHPKNRKK